MDANLIVLLIGKGALISAASLVASEPDEIESFLSLCSKLSTELGTLFSNYGVGSGVVSISSDSSLLLLSIFSGYVIETIY